MKLTKNKIIELCLFVMIIVSFIRYYSNMDMPLSKESLSVSSVIMMVSVLLFFCYKFEDKSLRSNYLRIAPIFIVGYVIVHFFTYLAYLITDVDFIVGIDYVDSKVINSAAICSLISLIAFFIGYIVTKKKYKGVPLKSKVNNLSLEMVLIFSFAIFFLTIDKRYFQGGYGEVLNKGEGLSVLTSLAQQFFLASCIAIVVNNILNCSSLKLFDYIKLYSIKYYIVVGIYCVLIIMSGDRGPLIQVGFSYFAGYILINRMKLGLKKVIPLFVVGIIGLNFLGSLRSFTGGLNSKDIAQANSTMVENFSGTNIIFSTTSELSVVVRSYNAIFNETIKNGTLMGLGFFDQVLGLVPGLRPYIVYPVFNYDKTGRPIDTNVLSTQLLNADHGMGTTCCADVFYNFGIWGTAVIFFLFGIFMKKFDLELYSSRHGLLAISFAFNYLLLAIYLGRGKLLSPLNVSIYTFLLLYLFSKISKKKISSSL